MARNLEDTAKHLIKILRQGGKTSNEIAALWLERRDEVIKSIEKLMKKSKNQFAIESHIHRELAALTRETSGLLEENGIIAGEFQATSTAKYLSVLGVDHVKAYNVTDAFVRRSFKKPMAYQNLAVNDLLRGSMASLDVSLVNITRTARATGATVNSIAKAIELSAGSLDDPVIRRKASALGRTAISQVSNDVRHQSFVKEKEVEGALYVATLDGRTSNVCKVLDGTYYRDKDNAKVPPLHVSCRSTLVPVLKGESLSDVQDQLSRPAVEVKSVKKLEEKGFRTRTGRIRKPSRTDRSPLIGVQKSKYVNYETWLKGQPVAYQKEILGPKALRKFKETGNLRTALGVAE